ncbi:hypothetical protein Tco_1377375, partial [Tanacetum coccineum]
RVSVKSARILAWAARCHACSHGGSCTLFSRPVIYAMQVMLRFSTMKPCIIVTVVPFENIASVSLGSILLLALHLFPYYHSKSMSVQRKPVSIGNVNCHADILNLTTLASIGVGSEGMCIRLKMVTKTRVLMINLCERCRELEGVNEDVGKIAMVVPILAWLPSSALNPNDLMFLPSAYRNVEDFSDYWWSLVQSSPFVS